MAVLAGGSDAYGYLSSVETYSPSGTCQHQLAPLPISTLDPILFFAGGELILCGGRHNFGPASLTCLK